MSVSSVDKMCTQEGISMGNHVWTIRIRGRPPADGLACKVPLGDFSVGFLRSAGREGEAAGSHLKNSENSLASRPPRSSDTDMPEGRRWA